MDSTQNTVTEQLPLFEDERCLINRGILELTRLNLDDAHKAFTRYRDLYPKGYNIDLEVKLTEFLSRGFLDAPRDCPDEPVYLWRSWASFEDYVRAIGFEGENIISEIKRSFFRKVAESINRCDLAGTPYLADDMPTGYVYMQTGQYDLGIKSLQNCITVTPDNAAIYGYLGDAYMLRGEPRVARQCYREACLINPSGIDWRHMKDKALLELKSRLVKDGLNEELAVEWLPSHARVQGVFEVKVVKLDDSLKGLVNEYLALQKAFLKEKISDLKPKLFFRGMIMCDNEQVLRFIKKVNIIDIRRQMKDLNPPLFSRYLHDIVESRNRTK